MIVQKIANERNAILASLLALAFGSALPVASASERGGHDLSAAGGIAAPSSTTAVFQNPAGLTYQSKTVLDLMGASDNDSFKYPLLEAGLFTGNGSLGAGIGVQKPTSPGGSTSIYYGFGFLVPNLSSSFGISGSTFVDGGGNAWNAGALFGSNDKLSFGVTVHDFTSSGREFGAGLNYHLSGDVALIADATLDSDFSHPWIEPALLLQASSAALTVGYGFSPASSNKGGSSQIADGISAGASFKVGQNLSLQVYYKQLSRYLLELTMAF